MQAFNHPWIQECSALSEQPMSPQTFADMNDTLDKLKVRRAVLLYLSQRIGEGNFSELQR